MPDFVKTMTGNDIRRVVLEESYRAHVGHIGSALSVADILAALYGRVLRIPSPTDEERDRFVMCKGHAALALYTALALRGYIERAALKGYCADDSWFGVHPEHELTGIDFSTGSLGQGLSFAVGAALAARLQHSSRRAFALLSDAECNEGSVWEAAMFAAHHELGNLIALVDANGQQALGYTKDVLSLEPLDRRWAAFGWATHIVDGHNSDVIASTIEEIDADARQPHLIVCRTTFGKGVSYMENRIKWHYWPMSLDEYEQAMREIGAR